MSQNDGRSGQLICSFCGKAQDEVKKLIAGPAVYICDECIELCKDIIVEEAKLEDVSPSKDGRLPPIAVWAGTRRLAVGGGWLRRGAVRIGRAPRPRTGK